MSVQTAPTVDIDWERVIVEAGEAEHAADAKATELRIEQRELLRKSLHGANVSARLAAIDRELDAQAHAAERNRIKKQEAEKERASSGLRAKAEQRERARVELTALEAQRREHLVAVESHLQALAGELTELRALEVAALTYRAALGLGGLGLDVRRLIGDRLSFVLGRGAGPAGLPGLPPLASKGLARQPLPDVFAVPASVAEITLSGPLTAKVEA